MAETSVLAQAVAEPVGAIVEAVKVALEAANVIPIFAIAGGFESTYQGLVTSLGRGTVVTLTANTGAPRG